MWCEDLEFFPFWIEFIQICDLVQNFLCCCWEKCKWMQKVSRVEYYETQPNQLISYLKPRLQKFVYIILHQNGKKNSLSPIYQICHLTQYSLVSTSSKIMHLKCKMRSMICISTHFILASWCMHYYRTCPYSIRHSTQHSLGKTPFHPCGFLVEVMSDMEHVARCPLWFHHAPLPSTQVHQFPLKIHYESID